MPCQNKDCDSGKPVFARGICQACYYRQRRNGTMARMRRPNNPGAPCAIEGCDRLAHSRGVCAKHYQQARHPLRTTWMLLRSRAQGAYPAAWDNFDEFLAAVGERPSKGYQLRRLDPDKPWGPGNFSWKPPVVVNGATGLTADMAAYQRAWHYLRRFGLREEDILRMREEQNDACPICMEPLEMKHPETGKTVRICLDHCHRTNKIRGLLHDHCNKALGQFDDNIAAMRNAITYLERHLDAAPA